MSWKYFYSFQVVIATKSRLLILGTTNKSRRWMSSNRLKLDPSKTELIWFHNGRRQLCCVGDDIGLHGNRISPVHIVRFLRVMFDSNLTMFQHVVFVCQNCYSQLRLIHLLGKALVC